jgi:hypothetical protein
MSDLPSVVLVSPSFPGGTTTYLSLPGGSDHFHTQVVFSRLAGVVTVSAKLAGSTVFRPITDGAVDLATTSGIVIPNFAITDLSFADAGTGAYTVTVTQK